LTGDAYTGPAENAANLYEYDFAAPEGERLKDLTVDARDRDGAGVLAALQVSEDGSYVYFIAEGVLAGGAVAGQDNLYVSHDGGAPVFIASLEPGYQYLAGPVTEESAVSGDGTQMAFIAKRSLTGYDNQPVVPGQCTKNESGFPPSAPCSEVYLYDAGERVLRCVSCNASGARPTGGSALGPEEEYDNHASYYKQRSFSEGGGRLFFVSEDALVASATNGVENVYEYEDGRVFPLSDVSGGNPTYLLDASASGDDVFMATADRLVGQDTDGLADVYDARVGGGFPAPVSPVVCAGGDACKPPAGAQPGLYAPPASGTFSGPGNPVAAPLPVPSSHGVQPRAVKLAGALRRCHAIRRKRTRVACERAARKRYGVTVAAKRSATGVHAKSGRGK
jgi:hypothetical protein